jgi:[ribosomal protein S5]-alanine N-acetyltransferase
MEDRALLTRLSGEAGSHEDGRMSERPPTIKSERWDLMALLPAEIEALIAGDIERAGFLTGVRFPQDWPNDSDARDGLSWHLRALQADEQQVAWRLRVIVERLSGNVIGSINLKGPPDADGDVEIGWGLAEHHRHRGYALEAALAVVAWVLQQPAVRCISATVPDDNPPSQGLAAKLGLVRTGETRRDLPLWKTTDHRIGS